MGHGTISTQSRIFLSCIFFNLLLRLCSSFFALVVILFLVCLESVGRVFTHKSDDAGGRVVSYLVKELPKEWNGLLLHDVTVDAVLFCCCCFFVFCAINTKTFRDSEK